MKKIIFLFSFFILTGCDNQDDIDETLNYINSATINNSGSCRYNQRFDPKCVNYLQVSDKGLATITTKANLAPVDESYIQYKYSFYLKNILVGKNEKKGVDYYINIRCKDGTNCIKYDDIYNSFSKNVSSTALLNVNNSTVNKRLNAALKDLVNLANSNRRYLNKDPFDN